MQRSDFRFLERLRVRWSEIDAQQIVFNGHYLTYFDTAIAGYWRALALPYAATMASFDGDLFVRKATLEYLGSARYDDVLEIGMRCTRIGTSSITFTGGAFRQDQLLVSCELVYVFADPKTQTSRPVPPPLRKLLAGFEAGEAMAQVRTGSWAQLGADAARIRTDVFVHEQRIPEALEWDEADATALHAVAYNRLGQAVGTGRLLPATAGVAKVGRMAVNRVLRGCRLGEQLLQALMAAARARGDREVLLHAQRSAESFYARLGFQRRGEGFEEAGIPHVEMTRTLD